MSTISVQNLAPTQKIGWTDGHAAKCVSTVSALGSLAAQRDGQVIELLGYYTAGDGGGQTLVYHSTGRPTADNGFYFDGPGADDYFEAVDKTVANVLRFGAKGDGTTNDVAAIQGAVDAMEAAGGGDVIIPDSGSFYVITSAVTGASNVTIRGSGHIKQTTGSAHIFTIASISNAKVIGLTLQSVNGTGKGIYATSCTNLEIRNNYISDVGDSSGSSEGISVVDGDRITIAGNIISGGDGATAADIAVSGGAQYVRIVDNFCISESNSEGITVGSNATPNDTVVSGNIVVGHERHGIIAGYSISLLESRVSVIGNIVVNCPRVGIYYQGNTAGLEKCIIADNIVHACGGENATIGGGIEAACSINTIISGNLITDVGYDSAGDARANACPGIYLAVSHTNVTVSGNVIETASGVGIQAAGAAASSGLVLADNQIRDCGAESIYIAPNNVVFDDIAITGNIIEQIGTNPSKHCVYLDIAGTGSYGSVLTSNNIIRRATAVSTYAGISSRASTFTSWIISGNTCDTHDIGIQNTSAGVSHLFFGKTAIVTGNALKNCTTGLVGSTASGRWAAFGADNVFVSCTNTGFGSRVISAVSFNPTIVAYQSGTTAPADGAWNRGDTIYTTAPSAGGSPGVVCTTAGTPGTWNAMASLAS